MKHPEAATSQPGIDSVPLLPDDLVTLYTGDDGHLYLAESDGRITQRLSWTPDDFSTLPGLPPMPGVTGDLEDGHVFAHPTPSADGQRVAVFGLLPTYDEEADPMPRWDQLDEALEHLLAETLAPTSVSDSGEDQTIDDVAGAGMVLVVVGDDVASDLGELLEATDEPSGEYYDDDYLDDSEDDGMPAFWPGSKAYVIHRDGVQISEPWEAEDGTPIHLDWAPDDHHLLVLHQQEELLHLDLVDTHDPGIAHRIASGAPLFWAWRPHGSELAIRTGDPTDNEGLLHLASPLGTGDSRVVGAAGAFYTPAWHPTGESFVYSTPGSREDQLVEVDADGRPLRELLTYPGRAAFRWDAKGDLLAVAVAPEGHGAFDLLQVLGPDGRTRALFRGAFLSFHWLHDGSSIVVCSADEAEGQLQWLRVTLDGESHPRGPVFAPTRETVISLHFFEQVSASHPFLSADGRFIVYSGYPCDDSVIDGTGRRPHDAGDADYQAAQVMVTPLDGGPTVSVGDGRYGCFGNERETIR